MSMINDSALGRRYRQALKIYLEIDLARLSAKEGGEYDDPLKLGKNKDASRSKTVRYEHEGSILLLKAWTVFFSLSV